MAEYRIAGRLEVAGAQAAAGELRKVADGFKKLGKQGKQSLAELENRGRIDALFANIGKQSTVAAAQVKQSAAVMAGSIEKVSVASALASRSFAGLAGALTLGGAVAAVRGLVNGMDALNDAADAAGASINKLAGLEKIAKNNASNLDQVTAALVTLNQALNAAPDSAQVRALQAIGLDAAKLRELDPADALLEVSRAFAKFADDGNKARQMQELLGKSSRELAPIIRDLSTTSGDYSINAEKAALEAERFNKALGRAQGTIVGAGRDALTPLLEGFNNLADAIGKASSALEPLNRAIDRLTGGQAGRGQIPLVPPSIRALLDQFGGSSGTVVSPAVRNLLNGRQLAPGVAAAAGDGRPSLPSPAALEAAAEATKKLEAARTKAAEAAKRQAEAEAKLRDTIAAQIADERAVLALVTQGIELDKARETVQLRRQGLTEAEIGQLQTLKGALAEITAEQKAATEAAKAEEQAREELIENIARQRQSAADAAADLQGQVRDQLLQNEAFGKTGVALALLTERRNLDRAAEIERFAEIVRATDPALADAYLAQAAALRELADARIAGAVQQEDADRAAEVIKRQQDEANELGKVFDQVGQSLSNSLQQAFTQGGSFLRNFISNIKAAFLNLVVRFAVQPVLTSVAGSIAGAFGFSGAANASGGGTPGFAGGLFDIASGGKTAFDLLSGGFTSGLGKLATTLGSAGFSSGASFVNGFSSALNGGSAATFSGASSAFNLGNFAGQAAPFLPAVFSLLQGDLKGAAFSGGGAAIGTALGGPIGGIIGSTLGSLLGGLFGGGGPKAISTQAVTTLDGTSEGRAGKAGTIAGTLDGIGAINQQFLSRLDGLLRSVGAENARNVSIASEIGLFDKRRRGGFNFQVSRDGQELVTGANDTFGNDVKQIAEALTTELLGPALRDAFIALAEDFVTPAVRDFLSAVETPQEIEQRIALVTSLQDASDLLNDKFGFTVEQMIELANAGANVDAVLNGLSGLLTVQEAFDQQVNVLNRAFERLNVAVPESSQALRDLILNTDKSTAEGRELAASLAALTPAFQQVEATRFRLEVEQIGRAFELLREDLDRLQVTIDSISQSIADVDQSLSSAFEELVARLGNAQNVVLDLFAKQQQEVQAAQDALQQAQNSRLQLAEQNLLQAQSAVQSAQDALDGLVANQISIIRGNVENFDIAIKSLQEFRNELTLIAAQAGSATLAVSRAQFEDNANRARLGDVEAAGRLPELGRGLLTVAAEQSATREDFLREIARVRQAAQDTEAVFGRQKSIEEQQLEALNSQVSGLVDVEQEVLTVEQAIRNLRDAKSSEIAAQANLDALGVATEQILSVEQAVRNLETAQAAAESTRSTLERFGILNEQQISIEEAIRNLETADQAVTTARSQLEQAGLLVSGQQTTNEILSSISAGLQSRNELQAQLIAAESRRTDVISNGISGVVSSYAEAVTRTGMGVNPVAAVAATDFEQQIQNVYQNLLGRAADIGGLQSFVSSGQSLAQIEQVIRSSQEFFIREQLGAEGQNLFNQAVNGRLGVQPQSIVQAFANGGTFAGGLRLVGERGPELEVTGPSRIFSAEQTRSMLSGGSEMVAELRAMRQEIVQLQGRLADIQDNTRRTSNAVNGRPDQPILVEMVTAA